MPMRLSLLLILLVLPLLEIWLLIDLAGRYGWWLGAYLLLVGVLGWRLIQDEKQFMLGRMTQSLAQGGAPAMAVMAGAKNMLAGILLIIPGVLTDAAAVILLLLPAAEPTFVPPGSDPAGPRPRRRAAANDDVIEGEYTREE